MSLVVHKVGGSILADAEAVRRAARVVMSAGGGTPVVVVSALRGATDALLDVARRAAAGDGEGASRGATALSLRHHEVARAFGDEALEHTVEEAFDELSRVVVGLTALRQLSPAITDVVVSRGERLAAWCMVAALAEAGVRAKYVDAVDVIATDGRAGNAFPDLARTTEAARRVLLPLVRAGVVPVLPGFIGSAPDDPADPTHHAPALVTLGRGGSDLTATTLGRALGAREVILWKDVPGLLTADPRVVPGARVIPALHAREAGELAYHGAKVLHPRALIPLAMPAAPNGGAAAGGTQLWLRPFDDPAGEGTRIVVGPERRGPRAGREHPVKAVSALPAQALVTVRGTGMAGVPGIAARAFAALERTGVSVSLISQASSEQSICLGIPSATAHVALAALRETFALELARGEIESLDLAPSVATVAVVGSGMAGTPGIAARLFGALAEAGVNVIAIAQGSSELNISVVVAAEDAPAAQRAAHDAFRLDRIGGGRAATPAHADVILLGFGRVGRELAAQIARQPEPNDGAPVRVVAVLDRTGFVFDPDGFSPRRLQRLAAHKAKGGALADAPKGSRAGPAEAVERVAAHALSRPILVDVTAGDTSALLAAAARHGMDLVLANKRPIAEAPDVSNEGILAEAAALGRRVRHEATVGAGLPVIDTIRKLAESGDTIVRIDGCPSGTLGFLFAELRAGRRFSEALRDAMARGYTEPDPRDDLSGQDVARKAVILARLVGWRGALADLPVESLVPAGLRDVALDDFLARLEELDEPWARRVESARERGTVLRYHASVTPQSARVGIAEIDAASPLAGLAGTDNQFVFTTKRYHERPLVITGPGAGPAVTAAGVLNDVLALAAAR
ncbi:aspartate kinase [Gemmatirosa kalamazoonensis]|uniref:Aspartate kinase n=1 Tax=Gemmatirosa kalamazoonensis TaxID=861299 RepID=W0RDD7_9BACT|nr:aspartate kinase [Gemmatirosa kalamazoonensis]AHG89129.1 aspartate kinase [Gemmatirosa kalamazoonensis]